MKKHEDALKTIGEVSSSIEVPVYVIRFWETKFKDLKPIKKKTGSRYYSQTQIDLLKKIKYLLYEKKLTIKGAILDLKDFGGQKKIIINEIKDLIHEIKKIYKFRGVAQLGSASVWGAGGRWFKSSRPDQYIS